MCKKVTATILVLVMVLALIPAITASAAGASPWTGIWTQDGGAETWDICFWQDGDKVVGVHVGGNRQYAFEGTLNGNVLTGTAKLYSGSPSSGSFGAANQDFKLTISADGTSISGAASMYTGDVKLKKIVDYSDLAPNYNSGDNTSFTGVWHIRGVNRGGTLIVQTGDKATVFMGKITGEGTISGNVLTATITSQEGEGMVLKFTMSSDGMSFTSEFYMSDGRPSRANAKSGGRLSPITYVPAELNASDWAKPELEKAQSYELIPDSLKDADLSKNITRAEFAGVCVKLYENLSGKAAAAASNNPFTDTGSADVLKAYNTGLMVGVSADRFEPNTLLNREQAATALTRVLKKCYIDGWSFAADGSYTLNFTQPAKFADDDKISDWAKPSVYFMAANGIIAGTGSNMFSPRAVTTAEQAANYASATREQALVIAVRMIDKLKDKPLDYTET